MTEFKELPQRKRRKKAPAPKRLASRLSGKAKEYPQGKVVRLSASVLAILNVKRKKGESWDTLVRRLLNIPLKRGLEPHLYEVWLLRSTGETFPTKALARGQSVRNGVMKGHQGKFEEPILVREVP